MVNCPYHCTRNKNKDMVEVKNKKGNKLIKIEYHSSGVYLMSLWVNRGKTCVWSQREYKTLNGAKKFANRKLNKNG